jgi:hypothetical protein
VRWLAAVSSSAALSTATVGRKADSIGGRNTDLVKRVQVVGEGVPGVRQPRVLRGRVLRVRAIAAMSCAFQRDGRSPSGRIGVVDHWYFVGAALPRTLRISGIHPDTG